MWQSLSFGANYKAAYCLSVCPAGEDVIRPFLDDRASFLNEVVRPLQDKEETIYVVAGSDAEAHVHKRFPAKHTKQVKNGLHPRSIDVFLRGLTLSFQSGRFDRSRCRLPFHVHRSRKPQGNRHDSRPDASG